MPPLTLRLAVCLFPEVTALDYAGPVELLSFISSKNLQSPMSPFQTPPSHVIETTYLAYTLDPVEPSSGPLLVPSMTYDTEEQFDIILVPGGEQSMILR
jgi:hypothetical protein